MTDEEKLESGQEQGETQEQPSPEVPSPVSGDKQASEPSLDLDSLWSQIDERIEKAAQSWKDTRLKNVDSNTENIERIMKYVKDAGGDEELALRNMKIDEIYARGAFSSEVPGRTEDDTTAAFIAISEEILSGAGIAFDDAEYLAFVAKHNNKVTTPESWRSVLQAHADRRRVQSQRQDNVTAAATPSSTGTVAQPTDEEAGLQQELQDLFDGKKGSLGKSENIARMREISAALDDMSPPVEVTEE